MANTITSSVEQFLKDDDWKFEKRESGRYRAVMSANNGDITIWWSPDDEAEELSVMAYAPQRVPENKRAAVSEFIIRLNWQLKLGGLEMDMSDGEFRYRVFTDVSGGGLITPQIVKRMTYVSVGMLDKYNYGILQVIFGGVSPQDAIKNAEEKWKER